MAKLPETVGQAEQMYLLGLPNPFLWGCEAGFLHFISFLGAIVGVRLGRGISSLLAILAFIIDYSGYEKAASRSRQLCPASLLSPSKKKTHRRRSKLP